MYRKPYRLRISESVGIFLRLFQRRQWGPLAAPGDAEGSDWDHKPWGLCAIKAQPKQILLAHRSSEVAPTPHIQCVFCCAPSEVKPKPIETPQPEQAVEGPLFPLSTDAVTNSSCGSG